MYTSPDRTSTEGDERYKQEQAGASRRQIYALVALFMVSVVVIGVVLAILSVGIGTGGTSGPIFQRVAISHTPVKTAVIGKDLDIIARVTGSPRNVTLSYTIVPNNATQGQYRDIAPKNVFMLLLSSGGDQYTYTIRGNEIIGDISYHIAAQDAYGNTGIVPTQKIQVDDFIVLSTEKIMTVYVNRSASTLVTIRSYYGFSGSVDLRAISLGADTLPGGLTAEFNPPSVTPSKGGTATSTLTIRATSKDYVPGGRYNVRVEGRFSSPSGTIVRNGSVAILYVPDFDFDIGPGAQTVVRQLAGTVTEQITPYTITINTRNAFEADLNFRVVGLPTTGVYYRWVVPGKIVGTGTTTATLQVVTSSVAELGTFTLTIYVNAAGLEKFKQVSITILSQTQGP